MHADVSLSAVKDEGHPWDRGRRKLTLCDRLSPWMTALWELLAPVHRGLLPMRSGTSRVRPAGGPAEFVIVEVITNGFTVLPPPGGPRGPWRRDRDHEQVAVTAAGDIDRKRINAA